MTREGSKKEAPINKKPVDRLCRTRHMPPGALAINTSRMKHDTRNQTRPRMQAPPIRETSSPPPPHTTVAPPPPHTTVEPPPPHTIASPPPVQTTESQPTFDECTFVPTPGVTLQVLQGPAVHHTTVAAEEEEEERDQTVYEEEEAVAEQAFSGGQRPMISIMGNGLAPSDVVAAAIRKVLIHNYCGNFMRYSELKLKARGRRDEREEYFKMFKDLVQWEPCDEGKMRDLFHKACGKRIVDIFGKIRKSGKKPSWLGEKYYAYLLDGWKTEEFKKLSEQNKTNRASTRGGAVHTTGRRAHHDVALELEKKLGRPPNPDELFMATHKKKNGQWVDRRAEKTHEDYVNRLTQATQTDNNVDGSDKLQIWKEVVGGKTRGRCYGTARLAVNVRYGVSYLTQVTVNQNREVDSQAIEAARAESAIAREEAALANARADKAIAETEELKRKFEEFQKEMFAWKSSQAGHSTAHASSVQPNTHAHYDDDSDEHSLDLEDMSD